MYVYPFVNNITHHIFPFKFSIKKADALLAILTLVKIKSPVMRKRVRNSFPYHLM